MKSIYWFKRDLRVEDNRAFIKCLKESNEVYPIFIFDEDILNNLKAFDNRLFFVKKAIENLKGKVNLSIFYGKTLEIFDFLTEKLKVDSVYTAYSFTWSGQERDLKVKNLCTKKGIKFVEIFDNYLVDVRKVEYTKIFSHFYKKWSNLIDSKIEKVDIELIKKTKNIEVRNYPLPENIERIIPNNSFYWNIDFLKQRLINYDFKKYSSTRDFLDIDGSSKLSPYIRFGIISIREIYNYVKNLSENFIRELAWREFWYHIKHYFPEMKNLEFQKNKQTIQWENNDISIEKFINGETGYPIVDAAIRQLKQENWIPNRARMIVGSFLTKDLLIDWRIGEKFFAENLIDYDEVVNIGNWQWIASVGPDPRPLRIFNPILQAKKFDPNCNYIKRYIPELKNVNCKHLINPIQFEIKGYHKPIVNHYERLELIKKLHYTEK